MARQVPEAELEAVVKVVAQFQSGAALEEIAASLQIDLPRRTLQRRLATLVEHKRLIVEGRARASRYRLPERKDRAVEAAVSDGIRISDEVDVQLPLSADGREIRRLIRRPIQQRQPVGYNRGFLESYRPNESRYLSENLCKHLRGLGQAADVRRPAGTYARKIFNRVLIDLSWNSSRLEGNTYSLLETQQLLELGAAAAGRAVEETQMILNHKAAIELLVDQAEQTGFNPYTIRNLHALLSNNLLPDPGACGRLRQIAVTIGGSVYHPLEVPQQIEEYFGLILDKADAIEDPFEQAFFVTAQLTYLQPFEDVNKRVSRLAANIPLIRENLSPLSFVDVPVQDYVNGIHGVYELNRVDCLRDVFVWGYERSSARYAAVRQSLGEPDPLRLKYRTQIAELVAGVVKNAMGKTQATVMIQAHAKEQIEVMVAHRFVEVVETELMSLHEGNIARYRLTPSEYEAWREQWDRKV